MVSAAMAAISMTGAAKTGTSMAGTAQAPGAGAGAYVLLRAANFVDDSLSYFILFIIISSMSIFVGYKSVQFYFDVN